MKWVNNEGVELGNLDYFCVRYKKEGEENWTTFYYSTKQFEKMGITKMSYTLWEQIVQTLSHKDNITLSWERDCNESYLIQHGFERLD